MSGKLNGDPSLQVKTLDAQELGPGAIIFRVNGKLYIVDAPSLLRASASSRQRVDGADGAQVNRIRIEYESPKNTKYQMLYETIKQRQVLEMLQRMLSPFQFPVELTIKTMGCDA